MVPPLAREQDCELIYSLLQGFRVKTVLNSVCGRSLALVPRHGRGGKRERKCDKKSVLHGDVVERVVSKKKCVLDEVEERHQV
jgi:hypothetical protein